MMLWLLPSAIFAASTVLADQSEPLPHAEQIFQLDDDLFSDLEPSALEEPVTSAPTTEPVSTDGESPVPPGDKDLELQRDVGGEDLGSTRGRSPLAKVATTMQHVKRRLAIADTAKETQQLQARIVQALGELLAQLQKQSQQKNSRSPPSSKSPSQGSKPSGRQQGPANESSNRRGPTESVLTTQSERDQLWEKVWGDLPATARQKMQSVRPEKFLPKYARLIEDYFRRLAEDSDRTTTR